MNRFKRLSALILALLLVAAPCVSVLAAGEFDNGYISNDNGLSRIAFNVTLKNRSDYTGARPAGTFIYTVEMRAAEGTYPMVSYDQDVENVGLEAEGSASFDASDAGIVDHKTVPLYIGEASGCANGTYTYTIIQLLTEAQHAEGFEADGEAFNTDISKYVTEYSLILQVSEGKVTQAVLKNGNGDKEDGFFIQYSNPSTPDVTYNVELHKQTTNGVEGSFDFDVNIELPNGADPAALSISIGEESLASSAFTDTDDDGIYSATKTTKVAVGDFKEITGLPDGTKVSVYEHDDGTYYVTSAVDNMTSTGFKGNEGIQDSRWQTYGTVNGRDGIITYINDKKDISLTGVSLRYAPFLAMAAVALFGFALSRRRVEDEI